MRMVVIDTGLDECFNRDRIVNEMTIDSSLKVIGRENDKIGHGTAVVSTIVKNSVTSEIIILKVYDDQLTIYPERLTKALSYCESSLDFDLILISSGTPIYSADLHDVVKKIASKNKCIISAFDNDGAISYPAAFEEVIGVDINPAYNRKEQYDIVEGNMIDIRGGNAFFRVDWLNGKKNIVQGSSVLAAYFAAVISEHGSTCKKDILQRLKQNARDIYSLNEEEVTNSLSFDIKEAIFFPFNKEIHIFASKEKELSFKVGGYYDIKQKFLVDCPVNHVLKHTDNTGIIRNFDTIDWNGSFDTIICGCVKDIIRLTNRDYVTEIVDKCKQYNKNVYFFDDLLTDYPELANIDNVFFPSISIGRKLALQFEKLRVSNIPTLAIMGTSSKQGKYTLQVSLLNELKTRGVNVYGLATEPSGLLLGFKGMMPFGYGAANRFSSKEMVRYLNNEIWKAECAGSEMVLTGCQSGTVSYDLRNERYIMTEQYDYLLGVNPDGVILVVNDFDDLKYIRRTISFIEASVNAKVIAIVLSSIRKEMNNSFFEGIKSNKITKDEIINAFNKPTYSISQLAISDLVEDVLDYYS